MDTAVGLAAAWLVVSPALILALVLALATCRRLRRRPPAESVPFWSMKPGSRYHVEIWPAYGRPVDFVDEFMEFSSVYSAEFVSRTVRRSPTDQVRVTPLAPARASLELRMKHARASGSAEG